MRVAQAGRSSARTAVRKVTRPGRRQAHRPKRFRLGRLQRLILAALAECEAADRPVALVELSRMVARVRGHLRRADRKRVHKNTFYRAVQALGEKGYVHRRRHALRLSVRGCKVIEERGLRWRSERSRARQVEQRLLARQAAWKRIGKVVGGTR